MPTSHNFGKITGLQNMQRVRSAVFTRYGVNVSGLSIGSSDTAFTYILQTEERLSKKDAAAILAFVEGCKETLRLIA